MIKVLVGTVVASMLFPPAFANSEIVAFKVGDRFQSIAESSFVGFVKNVLIKNTAKQEYPLAAFFQKAITVVSLYERAVGFSSPVGHSAGIKGSVGSRLTSTQPEDIIAEPFRSISYLYSRYEPNFSGWALAKIDHIEIYGQFDISVDVDIHRLSNTLYSKGNISPDLFYANIAGVSGHFSGSYEGLPNEYNTGKGDDSNSSRKEGHQQGPFSHVLLSIQVILGLFGVAIGGYGIRETAKPVDKSAFDHDGPTGVWSLLSCFCLVIGGALAFVSVILLITYEIGCR